MFQGRLIDTARQKGVRFNSFGSSRDREEKRFKVLGCSLETRFNDGQVAPTFRYYLVQVIS